MKQKTKLLKKGVALFLSVVMAVMLVPIMDAPKTVKADSEKTIEAGKKVIAVGNPTSTQDSAEAWAGNYVYYGKYDGTNPTKYRVLSNRTTDFGGTTMLLDCDTTLYNAKFHDSSNVWASSSLKSGLQGDVFLNKSGVFTDQEKSAITSSTKSDSVTGDGQGNNSLNYAPLNDDTVFVLDAKEASRDSYGYASNNTRKKTNGSSTFGWWLRSPNESSEDGAGFVYGSFGYVNNDNVYDDSVGVSPAFNINLSSVIFASEILSESGSYKLTLNDDKLVIALTSGKKAKKSGNTLTIPYTVSGDNKNNATQVSVLVTDKVYTDADATVKKYGKLADVGSTSLSGEGTFALPSGLTGTLGTDYHIYLLAEDVNGEKETDYATLVEITANDIAAGPAAKENLVYNGSEQALVTAPEGSSYLYSLTENADNYSTTAPKGKNAGTYTVYYKENASAEVQSITATISKKEITVAYIAVSDKVYDGTESAVLDYTNVTYKNNNLNALASGDTLTVTATGVFEDANAGASKNVTISNISLGGASAGNYKLAESGNQSSATGKITKKPVTVTAKAQSVEVNGTIKNEVGEAVLSGALEGHTLSTVTLTAGNVTAVGSSTVTPSNATIKNGDTDVTANYEITYAAGTLTVTKTQPKLKADTTLTVGSLTYGQALSDSTITGTMVDKSNEATEVAGTFAWKEPTTVPQVSDSGVTEYDVVFTPTSADYGVVELKAKVTVNAKELTVKADDKARVVGAESNPELTYTVTGLVGTDTKENVFSGALACAADKDSTVGQTFDITQGTLAVTGGNYTMAFTKGTMTVVLPELKVDTIQPGGLTSTTAKLNGSVSPTGFATSTYITSVGFKYRKAGATAWENVAGTVSSTFGAEIAGLTADSDYEYYAVMTVNGETTEKEGKKITFHTEKTVNTDTGKITVTVAKDDAVTGNPEVVVSVEKGNDVIASKELGAFASGNLTAAFEKLADGNYNVVTSTKDGDFKETKMLSITNGAAVTAEFTVLKGKIAAVVEVKEGTDTPKVAVDGLNDVLTEEDKTNAASGSKEVEVKLDVEKKAEAEATGSANIKSLLSSREEIGMYLNLSLMKTVTDLNSGTEGTPTDIGNANTKILCIAIPYVFTGRSGFFMARYHGTTAAKMNKFSEKPTGAYTDEGYYLDTLTGYIFLYAKGFSTYAIGYEKKSTGGGSRTGSGGSGGGGGYTPVGKSTPARPAAPVLDSKTDTVITVKIVTGQVYSIDGGKTWQASGMFSGLVPETEYSIVTKVAATSTANESPVSEELKVTTEMKSADSTQSPDDTGNPDGTAAPDNPAEPEDQVTEEEQSAAKTVLDAGLKITRTVSKVTIRWGKVAKADRYVVYATYCGPDKCKKVLTLGGSKTKAVIKRLDGKKLKRQKDIKVYVVAYRKVNGKETKLAKSILGHVVGDKNTKYTNVKSIKLKKTSYSLKAGKTGIIKAELVLENKKKKPLPDKHVAGFRYASSDTKVAKVDENGKITAAGQGTCYIYVYAANGFAKKIKVTVK